MTWFLTESPCTETAIPGPADLIFFPLLSISALTLPTTVPATMLSPTFKVPFCIKQVAIGPTPLSSLASMIVPLAPFIKLGESVANDNVVLTIMHAGVGAINESDVMLADTGNAVIVGFNVRPEPKACVGQKVPH